MTEPPEGTPEPGFEDALKRLETIVREMESGELSLDTMMTHFEEGSRLVTSCTRKLDDVEKRIEKLVKKDGAIVAEPFGTAADENDET